MKKMFCLVMLFFSNEVYSQGISRIKVAPDHHSFIYEDGSPFFWLADTGWELFHRLNKEEMEHYFKTRSSQGFNVIQAVALAELDGLHQPNAYGEIPLENDDPLKPKEAYFKYIDWAIEKAASYNLYIALLPTWGDKVFKNTWGAGPEIFNMSNSKAYGKWIGNRYKDRKNIIWILGGDRNPRNESDVNIWRAMGAGIVEGAAGEADPLISYHPQPSATSSSSPWFHQDGWLDFNMLQTGHCRDVKVWEKISRDYQLIPAKPTLNGEPIYEDHPVCFNAKELGHSNAYDIRKAAYLSVFAGSAGLTYGCHAVWQFYAPPRNGVNGPLKTWQQSLGLPAASQMQYLGKLIKAFPLLHSKPEQQLLSDTLDGTKRIQCFTTGKNILVYTAGGAPITFNASQLKLTTLKQAHWYDPRTGNKQKIKLKPAISQKAFTPPSSGEGQDWVLILQRN